MDLTHIGSSLTGKLDSYFRAGVLAIAVSFTADISIAQDYDKGMAAYQRGDYRAAYKEFLPLAEQGDVGLQLNLGLMYEFGNGVPANAREAARWYRLAADQGYAAAQKNLGVMYEFGKGVPANAREAERW